MTVETRQAVSTQTGHDSPPAPRERQPWRYRPTVRARFLAAVLALSALGLAVAGTTAWVLLRDRLDASTDDALGRQVAAFREFSLGLDQSSTAAFASTDALLYAGMQRTVAAPNEGVVALLDGEVRWVAATEVPVRLEDDPDLVAAAASVPTGADVVIRTLTTALATYRYVVVPVTVTGDPAAGALVMAYDVGAERAELVRTYRTYAWVSLGALLVTGVVGWLVAGRLLAPIRVLRRTAQRITDTDLSARIPVSGDDDLSDLTRTVNAMLDRLDGAFSSQRQLLDDAGHELRTPLTIVRGHLELMDALDPADVEATRMLVIDEVDRMHGLVDDLLTLATADRPDFVHVVPTDVARLTDDVADKARSLGRHRWTVAERAEVVALVDPRRITQALLQLAANAVKFAPEGSTVELSTFVHGDRLRLAVRDEGPGVAPADVDRIFERFARGQTGRGIEGSGLGLPIVAAIAAAHGGRVFLDASSPGGARFVVDVPLHTAAEAADETDASRGDLG